MARVCVDETFFSVLPDGRLTLNADNLGFVTSIRFEGPGTVTDFFKADFPDYARFHVRVVGGGGGAGGSVAVAGESASQAGGGGGGYAEAWMTWGQLAAIESVTVGAGGAGGVGANDGATGGPSSFGAWAVGNGGLGSLNLMTSAATPSTVPAQLGGNATATDGLVVRGGPSQPAIRLSAAAGTSGKGGDSMLGYGGPGRSSSGNGQPGQSYGGGGGGSLANNASTTGGAGAGGIVIVDVYF
jgi:hypothetical protein